MKMNCFKSNTKVLFFIFILGISYNLHAQYTPQQNTQSKQNFTKKSDFWQHVQFGGGFGLNVGSGFTDITIAPSAIYNLNHYVSLGTGIQGSLVSSSNEYVSTIFGASLITLFNPADEVQFSLELEETNVSTTYQLIAENVKTNFWNTGLLVGAGYRMQNVVVGARYDLLFDKNKSVYSDALMPFVRVYF